MRLIFLDVDGVITPYQHGKKDAPEMPDPDCVERLNRLILLTGAHILVSSNRRLTRGRAIMSDLQSWGVIGNILGITGDFSQRGISEYDRGDEIKESLELYRAWGVESFVILDDDADMGSLRPYLVRTEPYTGLSEMDLVRAIAILERW